MEQGSWQDFFHFSKSERRGIILLAILCLLSGVWGYCWPEYISRREVKTFEKEFSGILTALRNEEQEQDRSAASEPFKEVEKQSKATAYERPSEDRYTAKKGKVKNAGAPSPPVLTEHSLEINRQSAEELQQNGRLPVKMTYRIVQYRQALGGFTDLRQLLEVYEMTDSLYRVIEPYLQMENVSIQKLNVNTDPADKLMQHPYIHKGLAAQIVNYREKVKEYDNPEALLKLYFMDEELLAKLLPYISF